MSGRKQHLHNVVLSEIVGEVICFHPCTRAMGNDGPGCRRVTMLPNLRHPMTFSVKAEYSV